MPERKIDLFQAVRSYNQKSVPARLIDSYYVGDTHYFGLEIRDLTDEENWVIRTVYLNFEDGRSGGTSKRYKVWKEL